MAKTFTKVGSLRKSQKGGLYIKLDADVSLKAGESLTLQDPRKSLDSAVAAGRMNETKAEEIKAKIPEYVKYDVIVIKE